MVKHPAWAAAISSSGLVPFSFSNRVLNEYGVSASTPESVERSPLPARPVPRQTAFALRIIETSTALSRHHAGSPNAMVSTVIFRKHLSSDLQETPEGSNFLRYNKSDARCPLWVKSRHRSASSQCPLHLQKQTLIERVRMSALCQ